MPQQRKCRRTFFTLLTGGIENSLYDVHKQYTHTHTSLHKDKVPNNMRDAKSNRGKGKQGVRNATLTLE